jgi:hypothetical protein
MRGKDRATLEQMAELWENTAREAERAQARKRASEEKPS